MSGTAKYFVGADIGTTGCRVSIYSASGERCATASAEYALQVPRVGWAEQDPAAIFHAFHSTFREAMSRFPHSPTAIASVALSTVLHSTFPVDEKGVPLHPMLIFADTRAQSVLPEIQRALDLKSLYERTGCPLHPMYPLAKLFWFRAERPDLFQRAAKFISIKEYLIHRLTGQYLVDASIASGTGLLNLARGEWDAEALKALGLSADRLSPVRPTTHVVDGWDGKELGLPPGVPLVIGAGDGVLSTLGAGAIGPSQFTAMIGTSGAVRICSDRPQTSSASKNWCYNLTADRWVLGGAINNGGLAFRWARDKFAATEQYVAEKLNLDPYDVLVSYAEQKPPGSDGLVFLPFLSGERSPHWNANARGVLFGLNLNHGKRHLVRATLEGVLYSLYSVFRSLQVMVPASSSAALEIRASGSFTRSPVWVQMMADVFGSDITVLGEPQGSVFGAAAMGMLVTGQLNSLESIRDLVGKPKAIYRPKPENHRVYQELYGIYERLYQNLEKEFDKISEIQSRLGK